MEMRELEGVRDVDVDEDEDEDEDIWLRVE